MQSDNDDVDARIEALREKLTKDYREEDHKLELKLKDIESSVNDVSSQLAAVKWFAGIVLTVLALTVGLVALIATNVI